MTGIDPQAFEARYQRLQEEMDGYNVGEAIRILAQLPVTDERWDNVLAVEIDRCLALFQEHYAEYTNPVVIALSKGGQIQSSREQMIAAIGFLQGATFVVAALQEQGLIV